ncbi:DUF2057 family protein [Wenzhouxiangella sp. XN24]|uniref:DUF2057 family protein n=1 Tax=Wenzhouxiangella sp. XN24 TaxID=2713569 RepID=UPI0013ED78A4|nr:DUF2057 family protein [Wenzhouxiangella sp. XN24]NGX16375.1 DUF2057 domain-containing protein [Wenzhouxiangella sp. XN24]
MFRLSCLLLLAISTGVLSGCASKPITLHDSQLAPADVATIVMPEQLEVASVNGKEIAGGSGMMSIGDKILEVAPGRYEILVFYRELWELGEQHEVLRSDPALFVVEARAGERYRLDYDRPADLDAARELAIDFSGWSEELSSGRRTASTDSGVQFRRGLVAAMSFDDTLVPSAETADGHREVEPLPATGAPAAAGTSSPGSPLVSEQETKSAPPREADPLDLMKEWWQEASSETRRAFLQWLAERP